MFFSPKKEHIGFAPVAHGGPDYRSLAEGGLRPEDILDFSASVNPFPPAGEVVEAVRRADFTRYPDGESAALRDGIAARTGTRGGNVVVTAGVSDALRLFGLAFAGPGKRALVMGPTYGEYAPSCSLFGAESEEYAAREEDLFRWNGEELETLLRRKRRDFLFLCNPNNPTGTFLGEAELGRLVGTALENGAGVVLDEAYLSFQGGFSAAVKDLFATGGLVILRSMTKDYNLPGARLGYILAPEPVAEALRRVRAPWSVNVFAQEAGLAALEAEAYYRETWEKTRILAGKLRSDLEEILPGAPEGAVFPGEANFLLVKIRRKPGLLRYFAERRILVRDCSSFGLPDFIRIGVRTDRDNRRLVDTCRNFFLEAARNG